MAHSILSSPIRIILFFPFYPAVVNNCRLRLDYCPYFVIKLIVQVGLFIHVKILPLFYSETIFGKSA
jgi:hypothetical protein